MAMDLDWDVLENFCGSVTVYKWWVGPLVLTEGAHYLAQHGCAWLVDIIATAQLEPKVAAEEFQLWELTLDHEARGCVVTCRRDTGTRPVYEQRIEFTDCPRNVTLYVENRTLLLPREH